MHEKLNIPEKINVGFQNRKNTYSGKLAFIVYWNKKGKLCQEKSWTTWKDKKIKPEEYTNTPRSGFVLNKDVGGPQRSYGWNARREKVRVYDPRNFEIEITVSNLLFILQECSSIKGKGLEGEFVYSWSGAQLVLLPVDSAEYKESIKYTSLQTKKVTRKDMKEGCTYLTKDNVNVMYLGRHEWHSFGYGYDYKNGKGFYSKKRHVFLNLDERKGDGTGYYQDESGFTKLAKKTSDEPSDIYADEYDAFKKSKHSAPPKKLVFKKKKLKIDEGYSCRVGYKVDGNYYVINNYCGSGRFRNEKEISFKNGVYNEEYMGGSRNIDMNNIGDLFIELENGAKIKLN